MDMDVWVDGSTELFCLTPAIYIAVLTAVLHPSSCCPSLCIGYILLSWLYSPPSSCPPSSLLPPNHKRVSASVPCSLCFLRSYTPTSFISASSSTDESVHKSSLPPSPPARYITSSGSLLVPWSHPTAYSPHSYNTISSRLGPLLP